MTLSELKNSLAAVAFIIATAFIIDARYELAGAERRAVLQAKLYANALQVAAKGSTVYRYDLMEAAGKLSEADEARRAQLIVEKVSLQENSQKLQEQLDALR